MPKQKTKKAIVKRFRVTKNGKVIRRQGFTGHLNSKRSSKTLRRLRRTKLVKGSYAKKVRKVLGKTRKVLGL